MVTPSHHRVHHAINPEYMDKNLAQIFIVWDKLFGTFQAEENSEPVKYGLTKNLNSYNPLTMIFHEWKNIVADVKKTKSLKNKWMYVFGAPGWSHDGSSKTSSELRREMKP